MRKQTPKGPTYYKDLVGSVFAKQLKYTFNKNIHLNYVTGTASIVFMNPTVKDMHTSKLLSYITDWKQRRVNFHIFLSPAMILDPYDYLKNLNYQAIMIQSVGHKVYLHLTEEDVKQLLLQLSGKTAYTEEEFYKLISDVNIVRHKEEKRYTQFKIDETRSLLVFLKNKYKMCVIAKTDEIDVTNKEKMKSLYVHNYTDVKEYLDFLYSITTNKKVKRVVYDPFFLGL